MIREEQSRIQYRFHVSQILPSEYILRQPAQYLGYETPKGTYPIDSADGGWIFGTVTAFI